MPILWRYLLRSYFQVLFFAVFAFVAILLVSRSQDIARFASSGAPIKGVLLFAVYQIPYVLPLAIPIACLIAAILLFQRLSHTHELTTLRSSGLGIKSIAFPLLIASALLSIVNFSIVSELAPYCRILSKKLTYEATSLNPLFLLQKGALVKIKGAFIDMKLLRMGKKAEDVVLILNNKAHGRLSLITAKELSLQEGHLKGETVTLISSIDAHAEEGFDHLVIENQKTMSTEASGLSQFIQNNDWHSNHDYLPFRMVLAKNAYDSTRPSKNLHLSKNRASMEICRRISIGLATFTFTLIGIAFGMQIGRRHTKKGIIWAISLSSFFLICFISAKAWRYSAYLSCIVYFIPHPIIILLSLRALKRTSMGIE
jgi:lipopolysaccharide export system permease protein